MSSSPPVGSIGIKLLSEEPNANESSRDSDVSLTIEGGARERAIPLLPFILLLPLRGDGPLSTKINVSNRVISQQPSSE